MKLNVLDRGPDPPDAPAVARPPIILLHGLFGRARNLGFFQRRLAARRRTLAIDLRNHGDSPHGPMDYTNMASDLIETLDGLGALPATLVGHSMGGKAAMVLALNRPEQVHSLLVADIPPGPSEHGSAQLARQMQQIRFPQYLNRTSADALLAPLIASAAVRGLMIQNIRLGERPGWQIGLDEIAASMADIEGWPAMPEDQAYHGPTLFLAGGASPYIQPQHHAAMRRLFPQHRMETIEQAGHWLHADNPTRFAALLEEFTDAF
ncbi:alpha/beta fold hydrolase [Lichenicoccus sp.]|uniref:alpha/beta fold hydrolase n=1 Tax=Lichenicoccus sp. TaxID=2781899 RepID=UPI003D13B24F